MPDQEAAFDDPLDGMTRIFIRTPVDVMLTNANHGELYASAFQKTMYCLVQA